MNDQILQTLQLEALTLIKNCDQLTELENLRVRYLGKQGSLTEQLKALASLPPDEKRIIGQKVNLIKEAVQTALQQKKLQLEQELLDKELRQQSIDVTLPGRRQQIGTLHPVSQAFIRIESFFQSLGFDVADGPEIENEFYNFDALNMDETHPARAMHDTFYTVTGKLLRTHTSTVQIRYLQNHSLPVRMIAPGRVYRCDSDVTHTPMFHQIEGLVIDENTSFADLKGLLQLFMNHFFQKDLRMRFRPSYFPFTEPSAEVDIECVQCHGLGCRICKHTGWLEVLGCGMVHPHVLEQVNIDSSRYQGFAFGMGVDRLTMLRYQIDDLRMMFENDLRFLTQF